MKALLAIMLLAGVAHADVKKTKQAPDKFAKAAGEAFTAAAAADANGDLRTALGLYEKAHAISPHPSTIYNVADLQRRLAMLRQAIKSYETYLVMAPDAKDRADVEAVLDQLRKTPGTIIVFTAEPSDKEALDLAAGFALVDGEIKKRPGPVPSHKLRKRVEMELQVPPGDHVVDFVTSLTFASRACGVGPGEQTFCELKAEPRIDGNTIVNASDRSFDVLSARRGKDMVGKRVELAPGKQRVFVKDRSYGCPALAIDVAGGNSIAYAFINTSEYSGLRRCRTLDIKQHRLQFDP